LNSYYLPSTTEEVNAIARNVCLLSVSKITQKRVRRNTVVRGTCALPNAVLVTINLICMLTQAGVWNTNQEFEWNWHD